MLNYQETCSRMGDDELLRLTSQWQTLAEPAQAALAAELEKRKLKDQFFRRADKRRNLLICAISFPVLAGLWFAGLPFWIAATCGGMAAWGVFLFDSSRADVRQALLKAERGPLPQPEQIEGSVADFDGRGTIITKEEYERIERNRPSPQAWLILIVACGTVFWGSIFALGATLIVEGIGILRGDILNNSPGIGWFFILSGGAINSLVLKVCLPFLVKLPELFWALHTERKEDKAEP